MPPSERPSGTEPTHPLRVYISRERIRQRVEELGREIERDHPSEPLVLLGVLKGSFIFLADLARAIQRPLRVEFLGVQSYGNETKSSGAVQITLDVTNPVEGSDVVIVEDIVDTGLTLTYLKRMLDARHPRSLRVCVLTDKIERRQVDVAVDYVGFTIPNVYVIGYGFDHDGLYRNLPYVAVLEGV